MTFVKCDVENLYSKDYEEVVRIEHSIGTLREYIRLDQKALANAYAEIDRLTAELDISRQSNADSATECDKLRARVDELERQNANLTQLANGALQPAKPQWKPPASLKDGDYVWDGGGNAVLAIARLVSPQGVNYSTGYSLKFLRDWTDPPVAGWWRVTDGHAEYLGP